MDGEAIYQRIQTGILERRLLPGAKLAEERLAEVTGVSRTKIRQVLARLAHERVVTLIPNRGAYVARPSVEEAREMFETRRLIEPALVAKLCLQATPENIAVLREHIAKEQLARQKDDLRSIIRLSGEFHIHLVDMVSTGILTRVIRELTSLTCLIITLYDKPTAPACPQSEHTDLVDLIEAGDAEGARQHMLDHLLHIERTLALEGELQAAPDFEAIFAD
ncbi:GntR family transcriptional regulator [Castellaniella denitrificans]|uniref:GntR family transcriptional regulator n=1 Tax=Castellaniella denitrificans TaxID=56119 RepID=A0ABT4M7R3_9BURK|nr:GntR family transcriptional regulator [Castellaniella denitrificans]MCZ4330510.1 GntR family transcriptional regulator [Castellaniella denitrificans]